MSNFSDACKPFMAFSKPWHICISSISFTGDHTPLLPLSHLFPKIKIFSFLGNRSLPCHCCKGVHGHGYHEYDEEGDEQGHYAKAQGVPENTEQGRHKGGAYIGACHLYADYGARLVCTEVCRGGVDDAGIDGRTP